MSVPGCTRHAAQLSQIARAYSQIPQAIFSSCAPGLWSRNQRSCFVLSGRVPREALLKEQVSKGDFRLGQCPGAGRPQRVPPMIPRTRCSGRRCLKEAKPTDFLCLQGRVPRRPVSKEQVPEEDFRLEQGSRCRAVLRAQKTAPGKGDRRPNIWRITRSMLYRC